MAKRLTCDRNGCTETTDAEHPGITWLSLENISSYHTPFFLGERQFCSAHCVHLATEDSK